MKKFTSLLLAITLTQTLLAQISYQETEPLFRKKSKGWIDFQIAQHIGLNPWSSVGYVNDGFPAASLTEFRGVLSYLPGSHFGIFADMGIGIMPAADMKSFNPERMPMPHSGTQYYLREMISESGNGKTSAHFKMTFGFLGKIPARENLTILPYLGVGFLTMEQRRYEMILKEQGSNIQYQTTYIWNHSDDGNEHDSNSSPGGYLTGRLNFKYKLSPKSNLLLGVEYTWFMNTLNFYGQYINTFNANIERNFTVKGNKMNMLGLSVGISF